MRDNENRRGQLLDGLRRFVTAVRGVAGVRRIALVGSIVTAKPDPKDIDLLVVVSDDADLAAVCTLGGCRATRRLSIAALTCFSQTSAGTISDVRAGRGTAGPASASHVMRGTVGDDPIFTTISTR